MYTNFNTIYLKDIRRTLPTDTNRIETHRGNIARRTRESDQNRVYQEVAGNRSQEHFCSFGRSRSQRYCRRQAHHWQTRGQSELICISFIINHITNVL